MSATTLVSFKRPTDRKTDAVLNLIQHSLMIVGLVLIGSFVNMVTRHQGVADASSPVLSEVLVPATEVAPNADPVPPEATITSPSAVPETRPTLALTPRMLGALDYVTRRYRVSPDALIPVFEVAQLVGKERRIDPLLIVAMIGIESRFNPFAESPMGAQGLMQVIPRFHQDKFPEGANDQALLDPEVNIRVGVDVLKEAIQRRGSLIAGLQYYAGSSEPDGNYASKVLAEKDRLEQAARRGATTVAANPASSASLPGTPDA